MIKASVRVCNQENGGYTSERTVAEGRFNDIDSIKSSMKDEAVREGFHHDTKWHVTIRAESTAVFKTRQRDHNLETLVWVETHLSWPSGDYNVDEVVSKILV
jgi:hypothetical protein